VSQATRDAVTDLYAAYARRDFERVAALIDDDIDWIIYGPRAGISVRRPPPWQGGGTHGARRHRPRLRARAVCAAGHDSRGRPGGGDVGVAFKQRSTGRMITAHLANFLRFRDGRIIEFREFANTFDLVEQAIGHFIEVG
jgi:ketosteroid isomerase-like protein